MKRANDSDPPHYDELQEGIYVLVNKGTRAVLDLHEGKDGNGTYVQGWNRVADKWFGDTRWALQRGQRPGTWTLANLKSGTFLHLKGGCEEDDTQVVGWEDKSGSTVSLSQNWKLKSQRGGYYTIENCASLTYLHLRYTLFGFTQAVCSRMDGSDGQLWELERASRTTQDILNKLGHWDESLLSRVYQTHPLDTQYFLLPDPLRKTIWIGTGLESQPHRAKIFDHNNFVVKAQDAMVSWIKNDFKSNGYALLFGMIYGTADPGATAYNWYLTQDMEALVFFDAQSGTEYTTAGLEKKGFKPCFATF